MRVDGSVEKFGCEPELEPATSSYEGGASDGAAMLNVFHLITFRPVFYVHNGQLTMPYEVIDMSKGDLRFQSLECVEDHLCAMAWQCCICRLLISLES